MRRILSSRRTRWTLGGMLAALGLWLPSIAGPDDAGTAHPDTPTLRWVSESEGDLPLRVEAVGLTVEQLRTLAVGTASPRDPHPVLTVFVETGNVASDLDLPAVAGRCRVDGNRLVFEPAFPFRAGIRYRAVLRPPALLDETGAGNPAVSSPFFQAAPPVESSTRVTAIFPGTDAIPENLLKFYLQFSAPMSRGGIYQYIHLRTAAGETVELPFLEIDEELWDPTMSRLTLFLDPGRIKRGVRPLEEVGPSLEAGGSYVLQIDREWRDARGAPLEASFEKRFQVIGPDRDPPDPARWTLTLPRAGTREPLVVAFPEPMDQAITRRALKIAAPAAAFVAGQAELQDLERRWVFIPESSWDRGVHRLRFPTLLEDLAGNNIGKPFDVDLFERVEPRLTDPVLELPFEVR
ncbi:MAG: hypothetical protein KIT22_15100 [Verrucomicrobiae bacterium]|nr:hypothetical protein [Verrucomicrobiae bacterium]